MDSLGDADEIGPDEIGVERPAGLLTPETCAITGAALQLFSLVSGGPLQLFQYGVVYGTVNARDPALLWLVAPGALLALVGMYFGARARRIRMTAAMTGLAGAAVVVGSILVAAYVFGYLRILT